MGKKTSIVLGIIIIVLVVTNIYQLIQVNQLENEKAIYQQISEEQDERIENMRCAQLKKTELSFSNGNCMGIVYNVGVLTAYNVKLVFNTKSVTAKIDLGEVGGQDYIQFNKPVPSSIHGLYFVGLEWTETP